MQEFASPSARRVTSLREVILPGPLRPLAVVPTGGAASHALTGWPAGAGQLQHEIGVDAAADLPGQARPRALPTYWPMHSRVLRAAHGNGSACDLNLQRALSSQRPMNSSPNEP